MQRVEAELPQRAALAHAESLEQARTNPCRNGVRRPTAPKVAETALDRVLRAGAAVRVTAPGKSPPLTEEEQRAPESPPFTERDAKLKADLIKAIRDMRSARELRLLNDYMANSFKEAITGRRELFDSDSETDALLRRNPELRALVLGRA